MAGLCRADLSLQILIKVLEHHVISFNPVLTLIDKSLPSLESASAVFQSGWYGDGDGGESWRLE